MAVILIGNTGDKRGVEPLIIALKDKNPKIQIAAIYSLKEFFGKKSLKHILKLVDDNNEDVAFNALEAAYDIDKIKNFR